MNKNALPIRSLFAPLSAKQSLPALLAAGLLMGSYAHRAQAQTAAEETTHNLLERVTLIKASAAGTVTFTLAPEDPGQVTREHWPIVFIDYENDGKNIRQMYNLTQDRTFTVNISSTQGGVVKITGENGMWKLVSASQELKDVDLHLAPELRYVDLHDNVLGTNNATSTFALHNDNTKIETLNVATNRLKGLTFGGSEAVVRELDASENLFTSLDVRTLPALTVLNYSKNLLTEVKPFHNDAFKTASWKVFQGGDATKYNAALAGTSDNLYAARTIADNGQLNLTINKLNIATLPVKPGDIAANHYFYTLQQRYEVPQSPRSDDEWRPLETMDLSSQLTATGVAAAPKTTRYELWREIDPGTDNYVRVPDNEYAVNAGKITFRRGYGKDTKLFVAMTTDAFNTAGYHLESFERGTGAITNDGFDQVLKQPEGTASPDKATYFAQVVAQQENAVGDGDTRVLSKRFFRTNTFKLDARHNNYWYGYVSNDWANAENWTGRFVPNTRPGDYADNAFSDVVFASTGSNAAGAGIAPYGAPAIRDLYADQHRVVRNYVNANENGRAMAATPGNEILVKKKAFLANNAAEAPHNAAPSSVEHLTLVQAQEGQPNGTLRFENPADNAGFTATVEMFSKAFDGNRNKTYATWQYFGVPVTDAKRSQLPEATTWVRKYDRTLNVTDSDEKWADVATAATPLRPGEGYEITQPKPATYRFHGKLQLSDFSFPVDGTASAANYADMNILANPYTAAMSIEKLDFSGAAAADKVVYLFNTGSRKDWIANDGANTNGTTEGQYTKAIPANLAGHVAGMPEQIPSLSTFMIKSTGPGNITYAYANLATAGEENRAPRRRFHSLSVDVSGEKTADRLWLVEADGTTDRFDNGWDGEKIFAPGEAAIYAIQDRSYQVTATERIGETKVGFVPAEGRTRYTLTFHIDGEPRGEQYTLLDKRTGLTRAIHDGDTYEFTAAKGDAAHRFTILGSGGKESLDERGFQISADRKRNFTVRNFTDEPAVATVFDAAGKVQARFTVEPGGENTGTVVMPGAYIVRVVNKITSLTQRFVMP